MTGLRNSLSAENRHWGPRTVLLDYKDGPYCGGRRLDSDQSPPSHFKETNKTNRGCRLNIDSKHTDSF
ncbi:hypothetical protein AALO_G00109180 [Alosa alosa]|uniref:Uncharacterized protein n=1 Tax=Alosa alosa TaxID=278164 RepID=A0AAV6GNN3_9TELE|nr:hypothetical protein AALO_G00109180 [Alosa alosa]